MSRCRYLYVLAAFAALALNADAKAAAPVAAGFDAEGLARIALRYELPMPPKDARLILARTGITGLSQLVGGKSTSRDPVIYTPGYLLEEKPDGSIVVLQGTQRKIATVRDDGQPMLRPFSVEKMKPKLGGYISDFAGISTFVCAVQTAALGKEETAQEIWKTFAAEKYDSVDELLEGGPLADYSDPAILLACCIFDYLMKGRLQQDVDWKDIHKRMMALLAEFPQLNQGWRSDYFKELTATVNAPPPKPGSTEALLLECASYPIERGDMFPPRSAPENELIRRGFAAIPDLISFCDDRRVTAHIMPAVMMAPPRMMSVGEVARKLILAIAGPQPGMDPFNPDTRSIKAWWEKYRSQNEADLLKKTVFITVFTIEEEKIVGVNENFARTIADKYPQELPALCEEFTQRATAEAQPFALAEAIVASKLSEESRLALLSQFAQRGSLEQKRCFLQVLAEVNPRACAEILLPLLKQLPVDSEGPYWTCPAANFAHVVMQLEDDGVWREFLSAAKRSAIGLRMEMMNRMAFRYIGDKNRSRRLAFLAAFLNDDSLREIPNDDRGTKFEGPCAGFTIPRLHVRDLAAWEIAAILGLKDAPDEFWTDAQRKGLREKVEKKLADEKLPSL